MTDSQRQIQRHDTFKSTAVSEWQMMREQATICIKSGLLPDSVNTVEKAIVIAMKGQELGLPMLQAFSGINVIKGKPTLSPELMMALIYRNCPGATIDIITTSDEECVIEACRAPGSRSTIFKFTIDDAKKANLFQKDNWKTYPRAMLRSRCISEMARSMFPDAIRGASYTPEELEDIPIQRNVRESSRQSSQRQASEPKDITPAKPPTAQNDTGVTRGELQQTIVDAALQSKQSVPQTWDEKTPTQVPEAPAMPIPETTQHHAPKTTSELLEKMTERYVEKKHPIIEPDFFICPDGKGYGVRFIDSPKYAKYGIDLRASDIERSDMEAYLKFLDKSKDDPECRMFVELAQKYLDGTVSKIKNYADDVARGDVDKK